MEHNFSVILSLEGPFLSEKEKGLFHESKPLGYILFQRNCVSPDQVKSLTAELKQISGPDCPILIDQEGGRVQRLKPPQWPKYSPAQFFGDLYEQNPKEALSALEQEMRTLCQDLTNVGVTVNCAPVLDISFEGAHDVIGDRSFSKDLETVTALAGKLCKTFLENGITPVIKHMPGHGRAVVDSHKDLPRITTSKTELQVSDFKPFQALSECFKPEELWGMPGHVLLEDIDPDLPASLSPHIINAVIREEIGFKGFLVTDDIEMGALKRFGDVIRRAEMALEAGCDAALFCSGVYKDMEALANKFA